MVDFMWKCIIMEKKHHFGCGPLIFNIQRNLEVKTKYTAFRPLLHKRQAVLIDANDSSTKNCTKYCFPNEKKVTKIVNLHLPNHQYSQVATKRHQSIVNNQKQNMTNLPKRCGNVVINFIHSMIGQKKIPHKFSPTLHHNQLFLGN